MPSITALVGPSLLSWARKTANLEPLAAARKIGVPEGIAALEQLGVLVIQTPGGQVETDEMRAFSLYFDEVPVYKTLERVPRGA